MIFNDYEDVPTIRTRSSELLAIGDLLPESKEKILPFVCLSKSNRVTDARVAYDKWNDKFKGPSILSLADNAKLAVDGYEILTSPDNGFKSWIDFISDAKKINDNVIPSLVFNNSVGKRDFVKQLKNLESDFGPVVLKVNPLFRRDVAAASTAASVISSTNNILFILDVGQITQTQQKAALDATIQALNELRSIDTSFDIVTTSTSFPRMFQGYTLNSSESYGEIPMLEWENYHALGGKPVAKYGDYAGIHGEFYEGSYAKFVARIDYPTPSAWIFERRKQSHPDEEREYLYSLAAQSIITSESWDDSLKVWGSEIIREAASNKLDKFGSPGKWISVRMNLHIERIIRFLSDNITIPSRTPTNGWEDDWNDEI